MVAYDLDLPCSRTSKTEVLFALNQLLVEQAQDGRTVVLIVDEAHNVVRFVHDQHHRAAVLRLLHQQLVQREQHFRLRRPRTRQVQIVGHHLKELLGIDP